MAGKDGRQSFGKWIVIAILVMAAAARPVSDALGIAILGYAFGRVLKASGPNA